MIVIDASAVVDALLGSRPSPDVLSHLEQSLAAPHLLDYEVTSVTRSLALADKVSVSAAETALNTFRDLHIERYDFAALAPRVWELRHQFTGYDASYIALAEALEAPLVTCDRKLSTTGHGAHVIVVRND